MRINRFKITMIFFIMFSVVQLMAAESKISVKNYLESRVVEKKLSNGITILLMNRGFSPTLATNITFRVGSVDESYDTIGAAHILEHMLFKGTKKLGTKNFKEESKILSKIEVLGETITKLKLESPGNLKIPVLIKELKALQKKHNLYTMGSPYSRLYASNGGVGFNASTSRDKTGYYVQLPTDRLELWAQIESAKLKGPIFREYYRERDNIMEERLMRYGSSGMGFLYEKFFAAAFLAHPYRHPTIGWKSNIENMSLTDIRKFYGKHYVPSRMTISIVGKQDVEKTFKLIKKYFGDMEYRPDPGEVKVIEPAQTGEKRITVNYRAKPAIMIGWKKPTYPHRGDFAFDVMSTVLGEGRSSFLYKSLVLDQKIASAVNIWSGGPGARYKNLFMIIAKPVQGVTPEKLENAIYAELKKFRNTINEKMLQRVKNITESSFIFMMDSNESLAGSLAYYQTIFRDWKYMSQYTENINKVTVDDVKKAYDKYMIASKRTVAILKDSRGK